VAAETAEVYRQTTPGAAPAAARSGGRRDAANGQSSNPVP